MLQRYAISLLGYGLTYLINLICIPLIIYLSSASNYGDYVIFIGYMGILTAIAPLGLGFKSKRDMPGALSTKHRGKIFFPQFYSNILFAIILGYLFSNLLSTIEPYLFDSSIKINTSLIIAYSVVYTTYSQIGYILKFSEKVISYNILAFLNPVFFLLGVIASYFIEGSISIKSLLLAQIFSCLINIIIFSYKCYKIVGFRIIAYTKDDIRWDLKLGLPLLLVVVVEILITSSDRFVISIFMESNEVAYYTVAYTVASLILVIPKLFSISLEPRLMFLVDQKAYAAITESMNFAFSLFLLFSLPMIAGAFLYGELALNVFINSEFATYSHSALNVLMVGMFFYGLSILIICLMMALTKTKNILFINVFGALLNIAANVIIFNFVQNIIVAAYTSMISFIVMSLFLKIYVDKFYNLEIFNKEFYKIFFSSAVTYGLFKYLLIFNIQNNTHALIVYMIAFIVIYLLCLIFFKSFAVKTIYNRLINKIN